MPGGEASEGGPRHTAGADTTENRDDEGFDEDLADDEPAAGADGHADGDLAGAVCGAGGEEASEVDAGGEEHDAGQAHDACEEGAGGGAEEVSDETGTSHLEA